MTAKKLDVEGYVARERQLLSQVTMDETHIILSLPEGAIGESYEIALDTIKTPEQVVSWIFHLSSKQWVDREMLRRFIKLASEHAGIEL
ncbi:hypothetical protein [Erwinia sp. 9145]|uniref:hypothetical protein n=1 Tax=Erwinia sp. 9145 TaxID=1500895 RepID=UPI00055990DB|nr:hypothetical protein [Erwinia sp. 9145]